MKSKITNRTDANPFTNNYGTVYYRNYTLENGDTISLAAKDEDPKWGQIDMEIEYEQNGVNKNGKPKYKRVTQQQGFGGGGKKQMTPFSEVGEFCMENAGRGLTTVDIKCGREYLDTVENQRKAATFILGDIKSDIEKWGRESTVLNIRRNQFLRACEKVEIYGYQNVEQIIEKANEMFKVIVK